MPGPLAGVRVLDVTTVVLGPWATQTLGDLGADVIKVEPPEGDTTRRLGPARHPGMAAFFLACNRNKRSLVLDLRQDAGRSALLRLASTADAMLHNFRPEPAGRLGLHYEAFRTVNPRLVYCATYGFRARGPYGNKPAYDDVIRRPRGLRRRRSSWASRAIAPTIGRQDQLACRAFALAGLVERERSAWARP
jgi:crotonobetainyl-CoA:carnitine CoA-transferase CaiB-like acyl-CoA transferase